MSKVQTQHNYQEIYSKAIKGMPQDQHSRYPSSRDQPEYPTASQRCSTKGTPNRKNSAKRQSLIWTPGAAKV